MRVLNIFTLALSVIAISLADGASSESGSGSDIGDIILSGSGSGNDLIVGSVNESMSGSGNDSMSESGTDSMSESGNDSMAGSIIGDDDCHRRLQGHGKDDSMDGSMDSHCGNKFGSGSGSKNGANISKKKTDVPSKKSNANIPSYKTTVFTASMALGIVYLFV